MKNDFLITKEEFVSFIKFIGEQDKKQEQFLKALETLTDDKEYCNCFLYASYQDKLVRLLEKITYDEDHDISYFLYDVPLGCAPRDSKDNLLYKDAASLYIYLLRQYRSKNKGGKK